MMMLEFAFFHGLLQSDVMGEVDVPGFGTGTGLVDPPVEEEGAPVVVSVVEVESETSGIFDPEAKACEKVNVVNKRERAVHCPTFVCLILKLLFKSYLLIY